MRHFHGFRLPARFSGRRARFGIAAAIAGAGILAATGAPVAALAAAAPTAAQQINDTNAQIASLEQQIIQYESMLSTLGSQKSTLQNALSSLNISLKKVAANISVTQAKITQANLKLDNLGGAITDKEQQIQNDQASIAKSLRRKYQLSDTTLVEQVLSSDGLMNAWNETAALDQLNSALENNVTDLAATKQSLSKDYSATQAQQAELVSLKQQLASQQADLNQTKSQQTALLAQTKDSEATYQKLLAEAQAELASFSTFAQNAGGSKLLTNQTSCDSWGCYYNQRDALWGNMALNGTKYRLASDGCLITAMAMVMTHYGYTTVTPVTINSNPNNFAAYYPAYLLFTIHVGNVSATRVSSAIDSVLATGNPVIVGIHAYGGTHFVVLVSGRKGSYLMRDPYIANGKDISFTAHYSLNSIYAVEKVVIQ